MKYANNELINEFILMAIYIYVCVCVCVCMCCMNETEEAVAGILES